MLFYFQHVLSLLFLSLLFLSLLLGVFPILSCQPYEALIYYIDLRITLQTMDKLIDNGNNQSYKYLTGTVTFVGASCR